MRRRVLAAATALAAVIAGGAAAPTATAAIKQSKVVSANPVDYTPHVLDGMVRAIAVVGDKVIVGGNFDQVRAAGSDKKTISRHNIFAFDKKTGKIDTHFAPKVDGTVYALQPGEDNTIYVGGSFATVNGVTLGALTRLNASDGAITKHFHARVGHGWLKAMVRSGDHLYIGGTFHKVAGEHITALAEVDATTGKTDPNFDIEVGEPRQGRLKVSNMAVNPKGTRLAIDGTFTRVDGHRRYQIALINTKHTEAKVAGWATDRYKPQCSSVFDTYMRGIDFSPDGSYFVVVTTGGPHGTKTLCDAAARWETNRYKHHQDPTWVNYTGGDTLLSVAATGAAVYVGGHQRWLDNPYGHDSAGKGAVSRPGIGAINPETGKAMSWNPTRTRGYGADALVATPDGLYVGSDTDRLGHEYHGRVGMFPLG